MGGGKSRSSTSSSNVTQQLDRRIGAAEGSLVVADSSGVSLNFEATDHGAVAAALNANAVATDAMADWGKVVAETSAETVLGATQAALASNTTVASGALESNTAVTAKAMDTTLDAMTAALGFGTEALGSIESTTDKALTWASEAAKSAEERNWQQTVKWAALVGVSYFAFQVFRK